MIVMPNHRTSGFGFNANRAAPSRGGGCANPELDQNGKSQSFPRNARQSLQDASLALSGKSVEPPKAGFRTARAARLAALVVMSLKPYLALLIEAFGGKLGRAVLAAQLIGLLQMGDGLTRAAQGFIVDTRTHRSQSPIGAAGVGRARLNENLADPFKTGTGFQTSQTDGLQLRI